MRLEPLRDRETGEIFWVPSETILLHLYRVNSEAAGLYDESTDTLSVDPKIVHEAWVRDEGLRAALARACELADLVSQSASIGRTDVVEILEPDRVASIAELWRYYSPAAYAAYTEANDG
jgi:hypothetical protein